MVSYNIIVTTIPVFKMLFSVLSSVGICVEALCSPTSLQPLEVVVSCLRSIHTLLDDQWPRSKLGSDPLLTVELLNVLHRSECRGDYRG